MSNEVILNLGCGFKKMVGMVNVDAFDICQPDVVHDLNAFPYPWESNSVDGIAMHHTLEHLEDYWAVITECARILKVGGWLEVRVPDESSATAATYRDHLHVFSLASFHGIMERTGWGTNAWAAMENETVPLYMEKYNQVPFDQYNWMTRTGFRWLLVFCAKHMRNFIWEQRFLFRKVGDRDEHISR